MKTIKYILVGAVALLAFACAEPLTYEPAPVPSGEQVYFAKDFPAQIDLADSLNGVLPLEIFRVKTDAEVTVNLKSTKESIFTVPASVTFAAGEAKATFNVTYDNAAPVIDQKYNFTIEVDDEANKSPYGYSSVKFVGVRINPIVWEKFALGTLTTAAFWGEEERETLYYTELGDNLRYCYIENCFDEETVAGGGTYDPVDYYFYWNTETNWISIPMQYMGYTNATGQVFFGDAVAFYNDYNSGNYNPDTFYSANGFFRPYYDGNGGFYLADWYYFSAAVKRGSGYAFGGVPDVFIADGFTRTVDYNDTSKFTFLDIFFGENESEVAGETYNQDIRVEAVDSLYYYLPNYFAPNSGLAFSAPDGLVDGAVLKGGENPQYTGVNVFGNELVAEIGRGTVVWPDTAEYPQFKLRVDLSLIDSEGTTTCKFEPLNDVITVVGAPYNAESITKKAASKADYYGNYNFYFTSYSSRDDAEMKYYAPIVVSDGGSELIDVKETPDDATDDITVEYVKFDGLSLGWVGDGLDNDSVYAEYDDGLLYFGAQLGGILTYSGKNYQTLFLLYDRVVDDYFDEGYMFAGFADDNNIPIVDYNSGCHGYAIYANGLGTLADGYHCYLIKQTSGGAPAKISRYGTISHITDNCVVNIANNGNDLQNNINRNVVSTSEHKLDISKLKVADNNARRNNAEIKTAPELR